MELAKKDGTGTPEVALMLFNTLQEQIRELRRPPEGASSAPVLELLGGMMSTMGPVLGTLVEKLMERREEPRRDPLEDMARMATIMVQLKDLSSDGGGSGMDVIARELAAPLGRVLSGVAPEPIAPPSHQIPPSGGGEPVKRTPTTSSSGKPRPPWYPHLERMIPTLVQWAAADKDPEVRADFVLEELPDRLLGPIHELLLRGPEFAAEFFDNVPQALDYREWFGQFFGRLLEGLEAWYQGDEGDGDGELEEAPSSSSSSEPPAPSSPEVTVDTDVGRTTESA